ncbi:DUF4097 family beta strand repeat-containing protein [Alkalicoccobacillus porphyridii]|uniref:DUF4097 domain-containing protein n=1 Tax=Alkalicoccobacillus porphyridii TaxID=2597270 RepID=A0A553ZWD4_9BACI|nr:DUF4097 family beta strand repeat-containing protein [Alkalicoccobacillus porphyridii]TSB45781.1 DUF4097 domain-containing protein [Alkalicoccobacillus porphyridii]
MKKLIGFAMMGVGVILLIVTAASFFNSNNAASKVSEVTENLDGIKQLTLESKAVNWTVIPVEEDELTISISGKEVRGIFDVKRQGNKLKVLTEQKGFRWFPSFFGELKDREAIVYLPSSYSEDLTIDSVSGEVLIDGDVMLDDFEMNLVSGSFSNNGLLQMNSLQIDSVSGGINAQGIISEEVKADTVSGNIRFEYHDGQEEVAVDTVSGDVFISAPELNANYHIETLSGTLFNQGSTIQAREYSSTIGEGQYRMNISTLSGNITIE